MANKKYCYNYPSNKDLGERLEHGDRKQIAEITQYSYPYVIEVLSGKKTNELILDVALHIANKRDTLKVELKKLL